MAPEFKAANCHSLPVDVYAYGVTLAVVLGGGAKPDGFYEGGLDFGGRCAAAFWNARFQRSPVVAGQSEASGAEAVRGLILGLCDANPDTRLRL